MRAFEFASPDSGRVYAIRLAPMHDGGSISGVIAVLDNITDRRELSAKAAERQVVLDLMNEAYVSTDSQGIVTGWNRAAETTFGWSAEEALGAQVLELIVPAEDVEEFRGMLSRTWPGIPATGRFEIRTERNARDRDGRIFPIELAVTIAEVDGETVVHGLMHDITARKEAERRDAGARERLRRARGGRRRARPQQRRQRGAGRDLPGRGADRRRRRGGAARAGPVRHGAADDGLGRRRPRRRDGPVHGDGRLGPVFGSREPFFSEDVPPTARSAGRSSAAATSSRSTGSRSSRRTTRSG